VDDAKYFVNNSKKRISGVLVVLAGYPLPKVFNPKSGSCFHTAEIYTILWMWPMLTGKITPTCNGLNMKGKGPY